MGFRWFGWARLHEWPCIQQALLLWLIGLLSPDNVARPEQEEDNSPI